MFQKRKNGLKRKIFVILVGCLLTFVAGVCMQKQTFVSANTGDYVNATGSNLTYTREADGGINVTMQASDDNTSSNDKLIYDKTFAVTEEITAYLKPSEVQNAAAQYIVIGLMDAGSSEVAYEVHIAATSSDGKFNIRTSGSVWGAYDRGSDGIATVKFGLTQDDLLAFYFDGTVLENYGVSAQNFPNGIKVYFRAFAVTWWGGTPDKLPVYIRVGDPKAIDTEKTYYMSSKEDISYAIDMNGATATAVEINGTALATEEYTITENTLTLSSAAMKMYAATSGDYTVTIKNPAKDISLNLRVSATENLEIVNESQSYDLYTDKALTLSVWKNKDLFVKLVDANGNDVDATYDEEKQVLTLPEAYMQSLAVGNHTFRIISENNGEGVAFTVAVGNTAPPKYTGEALVFDRYQPANLTFAVEVYQNERVWLEGELTENDYTVSGDQITLNATYLANCAPGAYTFALFGQNGKTDIVVTVKDTEPAELISNNNVRVNLNSVTDAKFLLNIKYDEILSVSGNSITENDWIFNASDSSVVIHKAFFETIGASGPYTFTITSKNGANIAVTVQVTQELAPALLGNANAVFEKNAPKNVTFGVQLNESEFISVSGGNITSEDYTSETQNDELSLVLNASYLSGLPDGEYTFILNFTNGEIIVSVLVENALDATFKNGYTTLYNMLGAEDMYLEFNANYGVFLGLTGNVFESDYSFDVETQTLTIFKAYLDTLEENTQLTIVFDNGELTLWVEVPFKGNIFEVYEPLYINEDKNSVHVSAQEEYWTKVEYLKPTMGAYGGGVKFLTPFSAEHVIEIYVDFEYVPDILGTSFALTLSDGGYMMHYGQWPSELFATFSVGEKFLQSAYFGIPNIHTETDQQIAHELLKRSDKGYETFTFDIGETSTKIYFNGVLIRELSEVTRNNFSGNDVYVMFTPLFWHEEEGTTFSIKSNANTKIFDSLYIVNTEVMSAITINAEIRGLFGGVSLVGDGVELPVNSFTYTRDPLTGIMKVEIAAESLLYLNGFDRDAEYKLCIKSSAGNAYVPLLISNAKHIELLQNENVFDKEKTDDLKIYYALNLDKVDRLEGNGITADDYTIENGVIVIKGTFLSTFEVGEWQFVIYSQEMPNGQTFTVNVVISSASVIGEANSDFDINGGEDISYPITLTQGHTLTVIGNGITANDYTVEDGKIVFSKTYLTTLVFGEYSFSVLDYYTPNLYNTIEITLKVVNSRSPEFADGTKEIQLHYTIGSDENVTITLNANKGMFMDAVGGYITADLYHYDEQTNTITFYKEWFAMMGEDDFKVRLSFDNGDLMVRFVVEEMLISTPDAQPDLEPEQPTKGGCASSMGVCAMTSMFTLCIIYVIIKKKNYGKGV